MDTTQLLLSITLTVTTIFLIIIGIQLIFIFKELRKTLTKVNAVVDGFEKVGMNVEHGFNEVVGFLAGFKVLFKLFDIVKTKKNGKEKSQ